MIYINVHLKKTILITFLISLSLPVAAQYKIVFGLSSLDLPEPQTSEEPAAEYLLNFDGADDYAKINNFGFSGTQITVEFWARIDVSGENNYAFDTSNDRNPLMKWSDDNTDDIVWGLGPTGYSTYTQGNRIGELVHYALTYDGSTERLFVDGTQVQSKTGSGTINFEELWIGEYNSLGYSMDGVISDFRVWNTARTQTEIENNMNDNLTGDEAGLIAHYKLDSGSGTTAVDSAGTNDCTINGATWIEK